MSSFIALVVGALSLLSRPSPADLDPADGVAADSVARNVTYCTARGRDLRMDVYFPSPERAGVEAPLAVFLHGGWWQTGDKTGEPWLEEVRPHLVEAGFVVASINYRLAPRFGFPAQLWDAKCAIRHFRAYADAYGIDPGRIGAWGTSAGGHLAALLGVTDRNDDLEGEAGYPDRSSRVQAVVTLYAPLDLTSYDWHEDLRPVLKQVFGVSDPEDRAARRSSPLYYVSGDDPPFLVVHGTDDRLVPTSQARRFHQRLLGVGVPSDLVLVEDAGHGLGWRGRPGNPGPAELRDRLVDFFLEELGR